MTASKRYLPPSAPLLSGALGAVLLSTAAVAAGPDVPPVADLIGRWEAGKSRLDVNGDPADFTGFVITGSKGDKWDIDPNVDPALHGGLWMTRKPKADEMEKKPDTPEWARNQAEGKLTWRLRLNARKGEVGLIDQITDQWIYDARCKLTLKGNLYPGTVKAEGPNKKPGTEEVLEEGATLTVNSETNDGPKPFEFTKKWYDPPVIDHRISFNWANEPDARAKLTNETNADYVRGELNFGAMESATLTLYRQFVGSMFKAGTYAVHMFGVSGVVEIGAETLLGSLAWNTAENALGKIVKGEDLGKELFVEAAAATVASALLGRVTSVDPGFVEHFNLKLAEEFGEKLAAPLAEWAKSRPTPIAEGGKLAVTDEEMREWLQQQFTQQCRFQIVGVKLQRGVAGLMVVDRAKHEAELLLYVPARVDGGKSTVVRGRFNYIGPGDVQPPQTTIFLDVIARRVD
jgi:hypothetical protein